MEKRSELLEEMGDALREGRGELVRAMAKEAVRQGLDPLEVISESLTPAIRDVGDRFGRGDAYLPELVMAANALIEGLEELNIALAASGREHTVQGRVLIGTVQGDIHSIGKDIVKALYNANAFEVVDLGVDVPIQVFVQKTRELKPDIVGMSALLTTTMLNQRAVIEALKQAGLRDKVKVLVGGAPVTASWAEEIGADGYAPNAASAINLSKELLG